MLLKPKALPFDPLEWRQLPYAEQLRLICQTWSMQGYGSPVVAYVFYGLKIIAYVYVWILFCASTPGLVSEGWTDWMWVLSPIAFQKAIAWSMLFEVLGLGCGSGPLTGRFLPSFGGFLYWLRPGTTKLPLTAIEGWPLIGGPRRNLIDVILYAALLGFLTAGLLHPNPGIGQWLPIVGPAADHGRPRQDHLPGGARRALLGHDGSFRVRHQLDCRSDVGATGVVVFRGLFQAQQPLPDRRVRHDVERPAHALALVPQEYVPPLSRRI